MERSFIKQKVGSICYFNFSEIPGLLKENGELSTAYAGKEYAFKAKNKPLAKCYISCGYSFISVDFENQVLALKREQKIGKIESNRPLSSKKAKKNYSFIPKEYLDLSDEESAKFFVYTMKTFLYFCDINEVDFKEYLKSTDKTFLAENGLDVNSVNFVFKQLAYHATNRQNAAFDFSNENNKNAMYDFTEHYNPINFLEKIDNLGFDDAVNLLTNKLDPGAKKKQIEEYLKCLISAANFLKNKQTKNEVVNSFKYDENGVLLDNQRDVFKHFVRLINHGYGKALTFDFLKEFDCDVFDFPKPDLHIKRTMIFLLNPFIQTCFDGFHLRNIDVNIIDEFDAMDKLMDIVKKANRYYGFSKPGFTISNYLLDKMIYIICSGKLYLNNIVDTKTKISYLNALVKKEYKKIDFDGTVSEIQTILGA